MNQYTKEYLVEHFNLIDQILHRDSGQKYSLMTREQLNDLAQRTFKQYNVSTMRGLFEKITDIHFNKQPKRNIIGDEIKSKQKDKEQVDQINFLRKRELEEELKQLKVKVNDIVNDLESYKEPIGPTNYPKKDDALFVNLPDDYGKFESTLYDYHHNFH